MARIKLKSKQPLEKEIQKSIIEWLKLYGATVIRINSGAMTVNDGGKNRFVRMNSEKGCSDLVVCWRGWYIAIEVKRPGKEPTDDQQAFLDKVKRSGGIAFVATSIDDVEKQLKDL